MSDQPTNLEKFKALVKGVVNEVFDERDAKAKTEPKTDVKPAGDNGGDEEKKGGLDGFLGGIFR